MTSGVAWFESLIIYTDGELNREATVAKNATVLLKSSIPFDKTNWRIKIPKTRMTPNTKE